MNELDFCQNLTNLIFGPFGGGMFCAPEWAEQSDPPFNI